MNLVLDTLISRRSFRWFGSGLGLLATAGLLRLNDAQAPWLAGTGIAAALLVGAEGLGTLLDARARRMRKLAPHAFPFKNLPLGDREFLQDSLLRLPGRASARTALSWVLVCLGMALMHWGGGGTSSSWPVVGLCLGTSVATITQYWGNTVMARRVAPFYYFEGDPADELSKFMPTMGLRFRLTLLLPLFVLLPFPILASVQGNLLSLSVWAWLLFWALTAAFVGLKVFQDIVVSPIEDLGMALGRFGEGDYSALLDVTSGDALGVTTNRYNKTVRKIDRRFFVQETFGHLLPVDKNENLFDGGLKLDGEERELGIIACRLGGESMNLAAFNKFCQCVVEVVDKKGGAIDELSPGLVVAIFNAPMKMDNAEGVALEAAAELKERLEIFRSQQKMQAGLELQVKVGFSYGKAVLGLMGPKGRQHYSALGKTAEEARRLSSL
jgi:hypothetical protein